MTHYIRYILWYVLQGRELHMISLFASCSLIYRLYRSCMSRLVLYVQDQYGYDALSSVSITHKDLNYHKLYNTCHEQITGNFIHVKEFLSCKKSVCHQRGQVESELNVVLLCHFHKVEAYIPTNAHQYKVLMLSRLTDKTN